MLKIILGKFRALFSYIRYKPFFYEYHKSDQIFSPLQLTPKFISLGERVVISYNARIQGVGLYKGVKYNPLIRLGDGVSIQQNIHLTCAKSVVIGKNTAIAANVTITDIHHPYDDISIPIEHQRLVVKEVSIGDDCKIYNNVVVLPGVHIGKHVTIGANSVVTRDIPDYSVAVGNPAKVIKHYDYNRKAWVKNK